MSILGALGLSFLIYGTLYLGGWALRNLYNKYSYKLLEINPTWIKNTIWKTYYGFSDIKICICEPTHPFVLFPYMYVGKESYIVCISNDFSFDNWEILAHMCLHFKLEKKFKLHPPSDMSTTSMATILYLLEGNKINWVAKREIIKEEDIVYGDTDNKDKDGV